MASINQNEIDDTYNLRPEDDDLLDYFLSGSNGTGDILDELTIEAPAATLHFTQPQIKTEFDYSHINLPPSNASSIPYSHSTTSYETSSTTSAEFDGPDSPTGGENELDTDEEKRRKRLERNRISARESRARKKQLLELLKKKVSKLTEDISAARGQHLDSADKTLSTMKANMIASLYENISLYPVNSILDPQLEEELAQGVQLLSLRYGPNSDERQAVVKYYFQKVDSLILPPYIRFLLWMSIQDESFYTKSNPTTPSTKKETERKDFATKKENLWTALSSELGLTYEQEEKIKNHYRSSDTKGNEIERRKIALAVNYLHQLKENMIERAQAVQNQSNEIEMILTPQQMIRYQQWVEENRMKYTTLLHKRSIDFYDPIAMDPHGKISFTLRKPDYELTMEDISILIAALSKQHGRLESP